MSFIKKIETDSGIIGIWELTESPEELLKLVSLSKKECEEFNCFRVERRKKEYLATRIILAELLKSNDEIYYNDVRKPFLTKSSQKIAISHSTNLATVFLSERNIGIDVEQTNRNIDKITTRFLHPDELEFITKNKNQQQSKIVYWCAKEAIFKCSDNQGILFNKHIIIDSFQLREEGGFTGKLVHKGEIRRYALNYFFIKGNAVVYCCEI